MISYVSTPDFATLPTALLPVAKQQCRVSFDTDDDIIKQHIGWAISYCERFWDQKIFGSSVVWLPVIAGNAWAYKCPVQPVSAFTVMSDGVDVSSEYALKQGDPVEPVYLVHVDQTPFPADAEITLTAGFTDPSQIDPGMLGGILRTTAKLYEYRESITDLNLNDMPFWLNDMLGGYWIPRA
jgi:hypothetical protein